MSNEVQLLGQQNRPQMHPKLLTGKASEWIGDAPL